jgi:hypothetical protein
MSTGSKLIELHEAVLNISRSVSPEQLKVEIDCKRRVKIGGGRRKALKRTDRILILAVVRQQILPLIINITLVLCFLAFQIVRVLIPVSAASRVLHISYLLLFQPFGPHQVCTFIVCCTAQPLNIPFFSVGVFCVVGLIFGV